jgi:antitoxin ParD1/3/4
MTEKKTMPSSYAISEHFEQFIRLQVESGRFTNASEVVRAGLRLLEDQEMVRQKRLEELRQLIEDGAQSGLGRPADDVFDRLEARYKSL